MGSLARRSIGRLRPRPEFFGVLDVSLASLATFLVGLYAARTLNPIELGAYALCFRALFLAGVVSSHGVFWPAESLVAISATAQRLRLLRQTLGLGVPPAFLAALATGLWVFFAPAGLPEAALTGLTVTAVATAFLSPVQDHVRRMLHVSGASQVAAAVSGVQLGSIALALLLCRELDIEKWWVPFGTLAVGNLVSLVVGMAWARATPPTGFGETPGVLLLSEIWQLGRWLMLLALLEAGSAFVAAAIVAGISGAAALGYAEAARVVAQPVMVFAWGLSGVLGPRSVRSGSERDAGQSYRIERSFVVILTGAGVVSLGLLSVDWWANPMAWLLPKAYVLPGLVAMSIVAHLALGAAYSPRSELIGGRRAASMAKVDIGAGALRILVATSATWFKAYAVPLSLLGYGLAQSMGYRRLRGVLYVGDALQDRPEVEARHASG